MEIDVWIYDFNMDSVIDTETKKIIFTCDEILNKEDIIPEVIKLHNGGYSLEEIDEFLLDNQWCTQDEREHIVESIFKNVFS